MLNWKTELARSITRPQDLPAHLVEKIDGMEKAAAAFPMRINPYYLSLINTIGDPLWRQAVPTHAELTDKVCVADPLGEENLSPVVNLIHKYPDRVLFLVNSQCAMYCRFCTRKRKVGTNRLKVSAKTIQAGLDYIRRTPAVKDVLVSGGDPLLLPDAALDHILSGLRGIPSVEIIRIGTRVPCVLPMRVTTRLAALLKKFHPLYINTHFNHPAEITPLAARACERLANAGIPMGCQTVLLKNVNDDPKIMAQLMRKLLTIRVKPYYIFQADLTLGTNHFRTPVKKGINIMRDLIGHISGMAVPTFAVDLPGGGGKIPLAPEYITQSGSIYHCTNYCGQSYQYPDATE